MALALAMAMAIALALALAMALALALAMALAMAMAMALALALAMALALALAMAMAMALAMALALALALAMALDNRRIKEVTKKMNSDDYPTDEYIKQLFEGWYDPCELNNGELRKFDGLGDWQDCTFINPPYSNPMPWIKKAIEENKKRKLIVLLLKADTSTKWFAELQNNGAKFLWINGRLKYKTGIPAPFPTMIAILERNITPLDDGLNNKLDNY